MKTVAACAYSIRARGSFYLILASTLGLTACQGIPPKAVVDFAEPKPELAAAANATQPRSAKGSLFQLATYRPAFEDSRARTLGDIVTVHRTIGDHGLEGWHLLTERDIALVQLHTRLQTVSEALE